MTPKEKSIKLISCLIKKYSFEVFSEFVKHIDNIIGVYYYSYSNILYIVRKNDISYFNSWKSFHCIFLDENEPSPSIVWMDEDLFYRSENIGPRKEYFIKLDLDFFISFLNNPEITDFI